MATDAVATTTTTTTTTIAATLARNPTFLHRNWLASMGSRIRQRDSEDDYSRSSKRRRVSRNSPDSGIGLEPFEAVAVTDDDGQPEKVLRIHVLRIQHKDTSRFRSNPFNGLVHPHNDEGFKAKVRCRISIYGHGADGEEHDLLVDSQICTVRTYKNPAGPSNMVRIHLPQPFDVPEDKILVPRDDDGVFALADRYSARLRLEPAGDGTWPPDFLIYGDAGQDGPEDTPRSKCILSADIHDLFQTQRKTVSVSLAKGPGQALPTDYVLDVDVRWSSVLSAKTMKRLDRDVRHSIVCSADGDRMDLDTPAVNGVNNVNGHVNGVNGVHGSNGGDDNLLNGEGDVMEDVDDQTEGDLTPGRRRRPRPQINYNLKLLSDKAQHREHRRRQNQKSRNGAGESADDRGVAYTYRDQFLVGADDFNCQLCAKSHPDFDLLCLHYKLTHHEYAFEFNKNPMRISMSRSFGRPGLVFAPEEYQLGPPRGPLDPQAILEGDETWVTSRQGSENGKENNPYRTIAPRAAPDAVPRPVRFHSNQTNSTETVADKTQANDPNDLVPRGQPRKITVPKTKTTLYHPLSKAPLEPGATLDRYVADERWLLQKHRDTLGDYTDLEPAEIEFMQMWDSYFLPLHLSSELFLPPHYIAFTKEKADWIVEKPHRGIEFGKQTACLQIRGVIQDEHVVAATAMIQEANERRVERERQEREAEKQAQPEEKQQLDKPRPGKTARGCAKCGKFVERGPAWLKCRGEVSRDPTVLSWLLFE